MKQNWILASRGRQKTHEMQSFFFTHPKFNIAPEKWDGWKTSFNFRGNMEICDIFCRRNVFGCCFSQEKEMFWGETFFFPNEIISSCGGEVGFDVGILGVGIHAK